MEHTNLIIALVFAAVFGAALIWLAIYYLHRYIHRQCLELDHWFHVLTLPHWRSPCRHCEGTGRETREKSRSRSSKRRERSRSRGRREQSRHERGGYGRGQRMIEADAENGQGYPMQRTRQTLPAIGMEQYAPLQWGWQGQMPGVQQFAQPAMHPHAYEQMFAQGFPQVYVPVLQKQAVPSKQTYQKSSRKADKKATTNDVPKESSRVRKTDYIHIVDDYPPIVKEAMKKAAPPSPSSTSTEQVEEVPRTSIPQATPRFTGTSFFPFLSDPGSDTSASHGRSWHSRERRPSEQVRYASPYPRPPGRMGNHVGTDGRRLVSSNTYLLTNWMAAVKRVC
jgi:hypothetical protein